MRSQARCSTTEVGVVSTSSTTEASTTVGDDSISSAAEPVSSMGSYEPVSR